MTKKRLISKLKLAEADLERIKTAIIEAEKKTDGEISIAVIPESSSYAFHELFASLIAGAVGFAILLPFYNSIIAVVDHFSWHLPAWFGASLYGFLFFAIIALAYVITNIPAVDRLVIPRAERRKSVYRRALQHFVESGVYATHNRSGILIFISYMEQEVRILADTGISEKIKPEDWDAIAGKIAKGITENNLTEVMIDSIHSCGELLAQYFPFTQDNRNILADSIVILED
ncbi:hypothetical protein K7I13_02710 [Brucepastera parasyntrophica]|uniref:TPM domain-containing protein n=1 Tax=Brucepastera parasyntrophica TaxID=2880008 RepID=UPI00210D648D|nr:hypothetical protein [Brucepastera parasyntrophica]ULQ60241.1 hypothetical protein K7I13_02710 [Brucepastera parasyntrophica]